MLITADNVLSVILVVLISDVMLTPLDVVIEMLIADIIVVQIELGCVQMLYSFGVRVPEVDEVVVQLKPVLVQMLVVSEGDVDSGGVVDVCGIDDVVLKVVLPLVSALLVFDVQVLCVVLVVHELMDVIDVIVVRPRADA